MGRKSKQPKYILLGFLTVVILILMGDQLTAQVEREQQGAYLLVTSDINSDDIRDNSNSIYRIRVDGTEVKRVVRSMDLTHPTDSRVSSVGCDYDMQRLAVAFDTFQINGFYTIGVDGSDPQHERPSNRPVINGIIDVDFMPDVNRVVLSKRIEDNPIGVNKRTVLMSTDLNDGHYYPVQSRGGHSYRYPVASPVNAKIAYVVETLYDGASFKFAIGIVDGEGPDETLIYQTSSRIRHVDWSPDGQWLVAAIDAQLYKMRPDGSEMQVLTKTPHGATSPQWSPDGTQISFVMRSSFPNTHHLMVMDADGQNMRKVATFDREIVNQCWM